MPKGGAKPRGRKTQAIGSEASIAEGSSVAGAKQRGRKITKFVEDMDGINNAATHTISERRGQAVMGAIGGQPAVVRGPQQAIGKLFPTVYSKGLSKSEQVQALKHRAVQEGNPATGATPYGVVTASDKDFEWILKREEIKRSIDYDRLFVNLFNPNDPAHVELMRELRPEFFEERMNFIKQIASIQVHLAEIYLTGIRTRDDLDLVLGLQMLDIDDTQRDLDTGLPKILSVPVHKLNKADVIDASRSATNAYTAAWGRGAQLGIMGDSAPNTNKSFGLLGFRFPNKDNWRGAPPRRESARWTMPNQPGAGAVPGNYPFFTTAFSGLLT